MFAINHAATALILKKTYPRASLIWLLLSVQAMEFLWVFLNFAGIERTTTAATIRSVGDIHLAHMPYSHSIATTVAVAVAAWLILHAGFRRKDLGIAVGVGVVSHIVLDLLTHAPDIALAPGLGDEKFGLGLYSAAPLAAFALELAFGVLCWSIYRGSIGLLVAIVAFNLANLSLFSAAIPGPELWLGGRPLLLSGVILLQIVVTLLVVGLLARRPKTSDPVPPPQRVQVAA